MSATTMQGSTTTAGAAWVGRARLGVGVAVLGLLVLASTLMFTTTTTEGAFQHAADYWLTAAALPLGAGLVLHALAVHRLQRGRDGRLGLVGFWLYAVCVLELVVQCAASVVDGSEVRWGPSYPVAAFGSMAGLALLAAGSWRVGVLPRWMLGIWPPLALLGSFFGIGPIPLFFGVFLVWSCVVLGRRLDGDRDGDRIAG